MAERWREPFASNDAMRRRMQKQRSRDTAPEIALRRELYAMGMRYRLHQRPLPALRRQADIVFRGARVAVFVDGCFWHGCEQHGQRNHRVNGWYWPDKIERNRQRDRDTDTQLAAAGWRVIRVWEHERPEVVARRVAREVRQQRGRRSAG